MTSPAISAAYSRLGRTMPKPRPSLSSRATAALCALAIGLVATAGALAPARVSAGEPQIDFTLPPGFSASLYATGLGRARLMAMTPAGDIVLSSPPRRVLLVKADRDGDGRSDDTVVLLEGLMTDGRASRGDLS